MGNNASTERRWWWGGLAALAVLVLVALLWPKATGPSPEDETVTPASAPPADAPMRTPSPTVPPTPGTVMAESTPPPESPPPGTTPATPPEAPPIELPPTTQVLAEEFYPGTTEWEGVPVDETQKYQLRILPLRYNVVAPMPIAVLLEMIDRQGQRQPLPSPRVRMRALENASQPWITVPVKDDGSGSDAKSGDLLYTATLQPNAEQKKQLLTKRFEGMSKGQVDRAIERKRKKVAGQEKKELDFLQRRDRR